MSGCDCFVGVARLDVWILVNVIGTGTSTDGDLIQFILTLNDSSFVFFNIYSYSPKTILTFFLVQFMVVFCFIKKSAPRMLISVKCEPAGLRFTK